MKFFEYNRLSITTKILDVYIQGFLISKKIKINNSMKTRICILILGIIICACKTSSKEKSDMESKEIVEKKIDVFKSSETGVKFIMTSSGSLDKGKDTIVEGIKYTIVENEKGNITFWSTRDKKFKTPEGYVIGNQLKDISKLEKDGIYKQPGFGYFIKLESGWQLGFCEGESCTVSVPTEESIVKWMMKI